MPGDKAEKIIALLKERAAYRNEQAKHDDIGQRVKFMVTLT